MKSYSQAKEDIFLNRVFTEIGSTNEICVEFGGADGYRCSNTRLFVDNAWEGHYWDIDPKNPEVMKEHITAENINGIFDKYEIPQEFDLLSIDIDSNDYWVWKAITRNPRVVIIEFNPSIAKHLEYAIKYDINFKFKQTNYFGASFAALESLGKRKGYKLARCIGCNMIFIQKDIECSLCIPNSYKVANGWPMDQDPNNKWVDVSK